MKQYRDLVSLSIVVFLLLVVSYTVQAPMLTPMQFEIVRTPEAKARGLGGRTDIPHAYGMLFVFPEKKTLSFWMKDMLVPIDILWLADDGTILGIEDSVSPDSFPMTFTSPEPVRLVLEMRAGESRERGLTIGSSIWQK